MTDYIFNVQDALFAGQLDPEALQDEQFQADLQHAFADSKFPIANPENYFLLAEAYDHDYKATVLQSKLLKKFWLENNTEAIKELLYVDNFEFWEAFEVSGDIGFDGGYFEGYLTEKKNTLGHHLDMLRMTPDLELEFAHRFLFTSNSEWSDLKIALTDANEKKFVSNYDSLIY